MANWRYAFLPKNSVASEFQPILILGGPNHPIIPSSQIQKIFSSFLHPKFSKAHSSQSKRNRFVQAMDAVLDKAHLILDFLAWICLGWYLIMILMAISGSIIAFQKYRQAPPPPPFQISSSLTQSTASSTIRPSSKTQNLLIPSVSILRPLCGLDYGLKDNLESSFVQQWPLDRFEVICCVADSDDPAVRVVEEVMEKYPAVNARLLIGEERVGVNPKINNLVGAYRTAQADLLWILDSNARVHPTALARAVSVLSPPAGPTGSTNRLRTRIGLVHHVPAAILPQGYANPLSTRFGTLLEGCFLNGNHARQYLTLNAASVASCLMGKSNLFYRSDLERATRHSMLRQGSHLSSSSRLDDEQASLLASTGSNQHQSTSSSSNQALELFGQFLGEDNMIGQTLWDDGVRHATTIDVVGNVVGPLSVIDYIRRRVRWIRARKYMTKASTLLEPLTESILLGILMTFSLERLDLTGGWQKKLIMLIHLMIYFTLDYSVYRSLRHSPLFMMESTRPNGIESAGGSHHNRNDSRDSNRLINERRESIESKIGFKSFLIGWIGRESLALLVWLIAMSSDEVIWRKDGKLMKVTNDGKVIEN
ncbi:hypothetical protein O181_023738 [Austropuccinia psidii MF-1]|uniref:Ceramide glucosyltransferase n=1 Tax=Austropuccinia psidii MF-1 TaxID=1389203 RepID=A0A9Q3CHL9_9BASI|nr:hypothetical protein [Austropuccinia psidii MF-1]